LEDFDNGSISFDDAPQLREVYRIQLSYEELSETLPTSLSYSVRNTAGDVVPQTPIPITDKFSLTDPDAYKPAAGEVNYIYETGELILGSGVYDMLRNAVNISTTYSKTGFDSGELKPEHYFDCTMTDSLKPELDEITYIKKSQKIQYEVNFNQKLNINTEGSDAFSHQIGRSIGDIMNAVNEVIEIENMITQIETRLMDTSLTETQKERYNKMKGQMDTELVLKKEVMQSAFEKGITNSTREQDRVNVAVADLGSRYVRLNLTEDRLSSQKVDFEELLSTNEDADITETIIKYSSAETIYNASLSAASKIVQTTLLDFL
jgi:flagellar hook-associated protein 3 FlgL